MKKENSRKAFLFTVDAVLALIVSALLLSGLLALLPKISPEKYSPSARSALAAMEKTGALAGSINSPGALLKYAPPNTCAYIKIRLEGALVSSAGGGCECFGSPASKFSQQSCECSEMSVARRSFVVISDGVVKNYLAEMGVCTR